MNTNPTTPVSPVALVVDDDELLRFYAADILHEKGFAVLEAADADAALKLLETHQDVRLLFTDIQMPGQWDGLELTRLVHERWPKVLLIMASGRPGPKATEIPDDGRFIRKPYRDNELTEEVDDLLSKHP